MPGDMVHDVRGVSSGEVPPIARRTAAGHLATIVAWM